ncbi:hypothetical protein BJV77DRAFT_1112778 [Russula vinacea]|nr:hypothetical protein BJV77DRAFT_1112778 [Russula vinacea]
MTPSFTSCHAGPVLSAARLWVNRQPPSASIAPWSFHATPIPASSVGLNPFEVARGFFAETLKEFWYILRKDSYTDKAIGVTHVFSRQLINDIEVADGDINVHVMDSGVISHGNLFYRGDVSNIPVINESITPGPHMEFCNRLRSVLFANESGVVTMSDLPELPRIDEEDYMYNLYCWDCEHVRTPHEFVKRGFVKLDTGTDPRMALLWFMAVSGTPHGTSTVVRMIDNVPDAVSPVKAKAVGVRFPHRDDYKSRRKTMPVPGWWFEVERGNNWYEVVVSLHAPHRVLSVVDWALDAPYPVPLEHTQRLPAMYNAFAFGINDPSEGNRSLARVNFDLLASPLGWHVILGQVRESECEGPKVVSTTD